VVQAGVGGPSAHAAARGCFAVQVAALLYSRVYAQEAQEFARDAQDRVINGLGKMTASVRDEANELGRKTVQTVSGNR